MEEKYSVLERTLHLLGEIAVTCKPDIHIYNGGNIFN